MTSPDVYNYILSKGQNIVMEWFLFRQISKDVSVSPMITVAPDTGAQDKLPK